MPAEPLTAGEIYHCKQRDSKNSNDKDMQILGQKILPLKYLQRIVNAAFRKKKKTPCPYRPVSGIQIGK